MISFRAFSSEPKNSQQTCYKHSLKDPSKMKQVGSLGYSIPQTIKIVSVIRVLDQMALVAYSSRGAGTLSRRISMSYALISSMV
jgi:hypothetical protein